MKTLSLLFLASSFTGFAAVRAADTLRVRVTVKDKRPWIKPGQGVVTLFNEILNRRSEVVCTVEVMVLMASRSEGAAPGS